MYMYIYVLSLKCGTLQNAWKLARAERTHCKRSKTRLGHFACTHTHILHRYQRNRFKLGLGFPKVPPDRGRWERIAFPETCTTGHISRICVPPNPQVTAKMVPPPSPDPSHRRVCCVTQQTCLPCPTADMSAISHSRHVRFVTQHTCLLCHTQQTCLL